MNAAPAEQFGLVADDRLLVAATDDERTLPRPIGDQSRVFQRLAVFHVEGSPGLLGPGP
jgi:hypothetical protein